MKQNNRKNRYTLVYLRKTYSLSIEGIDVDLVYKHLEEINSKEMSYFISYIIVDENKKVMTLSIYEKIGERTTLEKIDALTIGKSLEEFIKDKNLPNTVVRIAYKYNKEIKMLPVIFIDDKQYIDRNFVGSSYIKKSKDKEFIKFLLTKEIIRETSEKTNNESYSILEETISNDIDLTTELYYFYLSYINKSYLNFRNLGLLLKEYRQVSDLTLLPSENLEDTQMSIEGFFSKEDQIQLKLKKL